ncbi:hypothetical protein RGUI_4230 (plasmid) [Rhodovulum sp. P5]|nr:hypothetical protein RGUI_4230 [Rhodovulum sp. P5]
MNHESSLPVAGRGWGGDSIAHRGPDGKGSCREPVCKA